MPAATRRLVAIAAALALVVAIPGAANATLDGLKETSKSTFTLLPDEGRVHADVTITLKNQKKPTVSKGPCSNNPRRTCRTTTSYVAYGWGPIQVPPDATNVAITGKGVEPVVIGSDASGTAYAVRFPKLNHKKKQAIKVAYDLPDGAGTDSPSRVTDAYAHFCWTGEDVDSGTTKAVLPAGWTDFTVGGVTTTATDLDGTTVKAKRKSDLGGFEVCTDAFSPTALRQSHVLAPGGQLVTLSGWPTDPEWTNDTAAVINDGLPALEETIGSPMPFAALTIQQVARTNGFGAPADLDTTAGRLFLDEDFDFEGAPLATLARTWFEDGSIADPWLAEGLSLWAGLSTAGFECPDPGEYPIEGAPDLLDWQVGVNTTGNEMVPVYQVSAACSIVEDVADAVGPERMAEVIDSLRAGAPRYGDRPTDPKTPWEPADWTDWLDAVDELGLTHAGVADLGLAERALTQYGIATEQDLVGRFSARTLYHQTLATMSGTAMPAYVDRLMEAWDFGAATSAVLEAVQVYEMAASHPMLTDDARATFLAAFESAPSPDALIALRSVIERWVPPTISE